MAEADPGEGPGRADSPLFLDQTEDRRAKKILFETAPRYLRVWMIPPLSEGLYPPPGAHNPPPLSRLIEFRFEIMVTGSPLPLDLMKQELNLKILSKYFTTMIKIYT